MEENNLICLSLIYYDKQKQKYKKYYNDKNNLELHYGIDPIFKLKNDDKILMEGNYNFIGRYDKGNNTFRWGWDYLYISRKKELMTSNTYYFKKIINYIFSLYINEKIHEKNMEKIIFYYDIKNMFLHHEYLIENPTQLELLLAITLYITKSDLLYKLDNIEENYTEYYILRNIEIL
jgi:hypothetical protein